MSDGQAGRMALPRTSPGGFWYTPATAVVFLCALFLLASAVSWLTPPFQSPDEFNHVARAYALSRGAILPESRPGQPSGALVDDGLLAYMKHYEEFPFHREKKATNPDVVLSRSIRWSGTGTHMAFPNTALYFPLIYAPQAAALALGRALDLTVDAGVHMARIFSLSACLGMLGAACLLFPIPLFVAALFVLPMTLFQLASASQDGVAFGMCVLAAALFMRGADTRRSFTRPMAVLLVLCLFTLATSRMNLLILTLLPLVIHGSRKDRLCLVGSLAAFTAATAWILYALLTVRGMFPREPSTLAVAWGYLTDPARFFQVMAATLGNGAMLKHYWNMFVGILGWLDAPLDSAIYKVFGVLFALMAAVCLTRGGDTRPRAGRVALGVGVAVSTVSLFVLILVCLPHPLTMIDGVQGRYFTPLLIFLGFALFGGRLPAWRTLAGMLLVFLMAVLAVGTMFPKLLERYWLSERPSRYSDYLFRPDDYNVRPGPVLGEGASLDLSMSETHRRDPGGLKRLGVLFRVEPEAAGEAELRLSGPDGALLSRTFSAAEARDGSYAYFELDGGRYDAGAVASVGGSGLRAVTSRKGPDTTATCLIYEYADGRVRFTPGCPLR
ncbi:DUF2142 domain-containing protein [Desulfovibrio aminophilus]|nr:DUF2142 domain-containing protein [Desulfovibrio aminophilus]MCM0754510.1 DUF2142 domain-containing protein [Desulfovibrio aminophilus]